jgi:hypothetical protein
MLGFGRLLRGVLGLFAAEEAEHWQKTLKSEGYATTAPRRPMGVQVRWGGTQVMADAAVTGCEGLHHAGAAGTAENVDR